MLKFLRYNCGGLNIGENTPVTYEIAIPRVLSNEDDLKKIIEKHGFDITYLCYELDIPVLDRVLIKRDLYKSSDEVDSVIKKLMRALITANVQTKYSNIYITADNAHELVGYYRGTFIPDTLAKIIRRDEDSLNIWDYLHPLLSENEGYSHVHHRVLLRNSADPENVWYFGTRLFHSVMANEEALREYFKEKVRQQLNPIGFEARLYLS